MLGIFLRTSIQIYLFFKYNWYSKLTLRNVAFLGLENAGKTSIIQRIRGDFQPLFANIKTNTVDRYFSEYLGNYLTIWEIPREIFSSHEILSENFSALQNIELVIYVIDIKDYFNCEFRGKIEAKNKGKVNMYFVLGIKPEYSVDGNGIKPNQKFIKIINKF